MTKKDYIKIARVLADAKPLKQNPDIFFVYHAGIVLAFADMLQEDNAKFNRKRFLDACMK